MALAEPTPRLANRRDPLILHLDQRAPGAAPALLDRLLVRRKVEANKQDEVGAQDADPSDGRELLACAVARVREPGEVGRGEVGPGGEVDEACVVS